MPSERLKEVRSEMTGYFVLAFIVLVGLFGSLYGVDSRRVEDRGWMAGLRR